MIHAPGALQKLYIFPSPKPTANEKDKTLKPIRRMYKFSEINSILPKIWYSSHETYEKPMTLYLSKRKLKAFLFKLPIIIIQ